MSTLYYVKRQQDTTFGYAVRITDRPENFAEWFAWKWAGREAGVPLTGNWLFITEDSSPNLLTDSEFTNPENYEIQDPPGSMPSWILRLADDITDVTSGKSIGGSAWKPSETRWTEIIAEVSVSVAVPTLGGTAGGGVRIATGDDDTPTHVQDKCGARITGIVAQAGLSTGRDAVIKALVPPNHFVQLQAYTDGGGATAPTRTLGTVTMRWL